ncbi:hypothetical protein SHKM778_11110 [Streptomyces sp. KM77-8]|uniref:Uncharacterized protein n=1 Tax=Streptomyces haneummycinicus TaxID=3074435 RepID=A0AAT9HBH5_9ACTN
MSLVELIARADERGLAASGLACLDRCVPLLGGDDEVLRPLWASLVEGAAAGDWAEWLERTRGNVDAVAGVRTRPCCSRTGCLPARRGVVRRRAAGVGRRLLRRSAAGASAAGRGW